MRRTALLLGVLTAAVAASPALGTLRDSAPSSPLDGRWKTSLTVAALLKSGEVNTQHVEPLYGPWTARFTAGRFELRNERTGGRGHGTFVVTGNRVQFLFASGIELRPGSIMVCTASVFRDRLTFTRVPGRQCPGLDAAVWTRVG